MTPASDRRIALVTGGNRGIGYEVCRQLAERGFIVLLTARDADHARAAAASLGAPDIHPYPLDIRDPASSAAIAAQIDADFGRLDVLVNNAGILPDRGISPLTIDMDMVRDVFETNVIGAWRLTQALAPLIRRGRSPRIVNVSSKLGSLAEMGARTGPAAYSVSKAALNALTRMLAADLRTAGVLVNTVSPGWVATDMGGSGGRPVEDGAASIVWAVMLPDDGPTGQYFQDGQPLPW